MIDILSAVAVELPCEECGGTFRVSLGQILDAQGAMRATCNARGLRECPGFYYAGLVDPESGRQLADAWRQMEREAACAGGELVLVPALPART